MPCLSLLSSSHDSRTVTSCTILTTCADARMNIGANTWEIMMRNHSFSETQHLLELFALHRVVVKKKRNGRIISNDIVIWAWFINRKLPHYFKIYRVLHLFSSVLGLGWPSKWDSGMEFILQTPHYPCSRLLNQYVKLNFLIALELCVPWTIAHQAPLSMEFSRPEYWSR